MSCVHVKIGSLPALRLQCQLMAFPPWPGACQSPPQAPGKKGPVRTGAPGQGRVQREVTACRGGAGFCCSGTQVGTSPQTPKSQASLAALKNSLEENLEAGAFRGCGLWNLRSECELDYLDH